MATRETDGHDLHARRTGDRRRLDEGVHVAARRAVLCSALRLGQVRGVLSAEASRPHVDALLQLPHLLESDAQACAGDRGDCGSIPPREPTSCISDAASTIRSRSRARFKLKEISYIHAEGYPAGEMKHGPIALIDEQMPVVAIAPTDHVFEKMIGNMQGSEGAGRLRRRL